MIKVGLTGGIGSGKSTVCRLFSMLAVPVYDSDSRARHLMSEDYGVIASITQLLGQESYVNGGLNRAYVGSCVFTNPELLAQLNRVVHPAVGADFMKWCDEHADANYVLLESAILFESGFDKYVDRTIAVSAPELERVDRTMRRDGSTIESVRARIANQMSDEQREARADYVIHNDENRMIMDQVLKLHELLKIGAK